MSIKDEILKAKQTYLIRNCSVEPDFLFIDTDSYVKLSEEVSALAESLSSILGGELIILSVDRKHINWHEKSKLEFAANNWSEDTDALDITFENENNTRDINWFDREEIKEYIHRTRL